MKTVLEVTFDDVTQEANIITSHVRAFSNIRLDENINVSYS